MNNKTILIRLSGELYTRIGEAIKKTGETKSSFVRRILSDYLTHMEGE